MKPPLNRGQIELWLVLLADIVIWAIIIFCISQIIEATRADELEVYPSGYAVIYPTQPGMPFVPDYMAPRLRVQRLGTQIQIQQTYPGTDVPDFSDGQGYVIQTYPGAGFGAFGTLPRPLDLKQ